MKKKYLLLLFFFSHVGAMEYDQESDQSLRIQLELLRSECERLRKDFDALQQAHIDFLEHLSQMGDIVVAHAMAIRDTQIELTEIRRLTPPPSRISYEERQDLDELASKMPSSMQRKKIKIRVRKK